MAETIAMTPPDRDGQQLFWTRTETDGGTLFLPEDPDKSATNILVPGNYRAEVGKDGTCFGVGALPQGPGIGHHEAGYVHRLDGFAVKTAPFKTQERMLDWLAANLMLNNAIKELGEGNNDYIVREVLGKSYKIKTPSYFGVLALGGSTGKSVIVMSDEAQFDGKAPTSRIFEEMYVKLLSITMSAIENLYPDSNIEWDSGRQNWIIRSSDETLIRLDLFGTDPSKVPIRPTVRL